MRGRQARHAAQRAAVLSDDALWGVVFAEVVAWQDEHGGGDREREHADRIAAALPPEARTGLTAAERRDLIGRHVARLMTELNEETR